MASIAGREISENFERTRSSSIERSWMEARLQRAAPADVGAPLQMADTPVHTQGDAPDCLLQCARMAEHRQTGLDPGLEVYKNRAQQEGIYNPETGTNAEKFAGIMAERPGLYVESGSAQGPEAIESALDQGKSVIIGVDAYKYYRSEANLEPNSGGHALVVTGAEQQADGAWQFAVNDPNDSSPNLPVDGSRLLPAWSDAGRMMMTIEARPGG
mgnify:CR=1 FL=1